ncbi:MAG: hypothetical protein KA072_03425 [Thermoanaerobaculaceae bacterium]|nr:hypothetical protein [Thermoanaerobaculaceae bacterium]MDI9620863.1 PilX N-terminal domain-containing pilus assembly protein [Acidobacteriota bacterium]NLH10134.1 hypothetical protein [Holophagae bacterium]HPW54731.1 PilX N-terminal domain-containing pilus assembly protein [Thermoanaerobaculaceae bacterium]
MRKITRKQRGIALVTVVLILLVLTVLGLTATIMMTQEDRLSSRMELQKEAFYAAEAGMRHGERVCNGITFTADALTSMLREPFAAHAPAPNPATSPGLPQHPGPSRDPADWTNDRLGNFLRELADESNAAGELVSVAYPISNREVSIASLSGRGRNRRAYYSLYVRNNPEDMGNLQVPPLNQDPDNRLRLVSVGFVTDGNGVNNLGQANVLAVRILEEELSWEVRSGGTENQDLQDTGATASGVWSGKRRRTPTPVPGP